MIINPYSFATAGGGGGGGGGFPAYLDTTTSTFVASTTHNVAMPATAAVGDLLLVDFTTYNSVSTTTPAGWTYITTASESNGGLVKSQLYMKVAAGTEGGATVDFVTTTSRVAVSHVHRIQSGTFNSGATPEIAAATPAITAAPDSPSLSPSWGALNTLWLVKSFHYDPSITTTSYPYVTGNNRTSANAGGIGAVLSSCFTTNAAASLNPPAFALSGDSEWGAHTVAIRPV